MLNKELRKCNNLGYYDWSNLTTSGILTYTQVKRMVNKENWNYEPIFINEEKGTFTFVDNKDYKEEYNLRAYKDWKKEFFFLNGELSYRKSIAAVKPLENSFVKKHPLMYLGWETGIVHIQDIKHYLEVCCEENKF